MSSPFSLPLLTLLSILVTLLNPIFTAREEIWGPVVHPKSPTDQLSPEIVKEDEGNVSNPATIAEVIDKALADEFKNEQNEVLTEGKDFNETQKNKDAQIETVVRLSHKNQRSPEQQISGAELEAGGSPIEGQFQVDSSDNQVEEVNQESSESTTNQEIKEIDVENQEVDRIMDSHDNVFVMSSPHDWNALTLDPQLIQDLTVIFTTSAIGGSISEILRQPIINSYLIAGSLVGPGALKWVKELVQVESLAQVGIQLLLFGLGLEFSFQKLAKVKNVAIYGGSLQILIFITITGIGAGMIGGSVYEGILIGAMLSMSSTSVVIKSLGDLRSHTSAFSQITVGTLILQDCTVGLMFALLPVLSGLASQEGSTSLDERGRIVLIILRLFFKIIVTFASTWLLAAYFFPFLMSWLYRSASKELFQLIVIGWCMVGAWLGGYLGISHELGAFLAGVMLSGSAEHDKVLEMTEQVRNVFVGLFMASIGLIMSPAFLWNHGLILAVGTTIVIIAKTAVIAMVVAFFGFDVLTSLFVGISLAQVGEFAFVLLSIGRQLELIHQHVYLLMLGMTALSLLVTPLMLQFTLRSMNSSLIREEKLPVSNGDDGFNVVTNSLLKNRKEKERQSQQQLSQLLQMQEKESILPIVEGLAVNLTEARERQHGKMLVDQ